MKILLVDDDPFGMKPYVLALQTEGHQVEVAGDPDLALKLLAQSASFAVVVLDVMMPTGEVLAEADVEHGLTTGRELFKLIRERYPRLPVVVLSITSAEDFGVEDVEFLPKADTMPPELVEAISRIAAKESER